MPHLPGNVDSLIKSDIFTVLNVFLPLSDSSWFLEGFHNQGRSRKYHLNLSLSVLNGQFHCHSCTHPITSCLGSVITNSLWRQTQGADLGEQGRHDTNFPTGTPQIHDFDLVGLGGSVGKKCARNAGDPSSNPWSVFELPLGQEDALEKGMTTHSGILAWRIPWLEEPGRLLSMGLQRVGHD